MITPTQRPRSSTSARPSAGSPAGFQAVCEAGRPCSPCPRFQQQCRRTSSSSGSETFAPAASPALAATPGQPELDSTRWDREINLLSEMGIAVDTDTLRKLLDSHQGVIAGVLSEFFRSGEAK